MADHLPRLWELTLRVRDDVKVHTYMILYRLIATFLNTVTTCLHASNNIIVCGIVITMQKNTFFTRHMHARPHILSDLHTLYFNGYIMYAAVQNVMSYCQLCFNQMTLNVVGIGEESC